MVRIKDAFDALLPLLIIGLLACGVFVIGYHVGHDNALTEDQGCCAGYRRLMDACYEQGNPVLQFWDERTDTVVTVCERGCDCTDMYDCPLLPDIPERFKSRHPEPREEQR